MAAVRNIFASKRIGGIGYSRSSSADDERPIMNLIYWGRDRMGRDCYIWERYDAQKDRRIPVVVIDAANRFLHNENAVDELYVAYPKNDAYYHEPDYKIHPNEWDIYRDEHDWDWHENRDKFYRFAYEN